ncbi:MAG: bifunctional methylenetetrahydrofolate dehydrogenase/methenyltetrahydrofolate cyclohydrolase FolD [Candidatus Fournierella pullistercoris]|uniref:Bifunctional protein FolD n=1 Tax=Candidatus Allofournierella pullistercoris TaxID=2838597 RepID=A0A948T2E9_9FIRM|nr:bifunctional methylenetetrahydrofolate dehydrogenase/methenyltetrahydrofolate cyclohydrolase FolD [Candidatus Fournierella pullistercoris]
MAQIISGKELAQQVKNRVSQQVIQLKEKGIYPCLAVVLVGKNPASMTYVRGKEKDCQQCGIESRVIHLPEDTGQQALLELLHSLAVDSQVHGILVQLPLPAHLDEQAVIEAIPPEKDVDGFTPVNVGRMMIGQSCFLPCTPAGCMEMLRHTNINLTGKRAVVLGRSNIVGKPMSMLLLQQNATVTICHSRTENLKEICARADVLIAAVGKPRFVTQEMVKLGAVVIDVGINRLEDGTLCGDVDFEAVAEHASAITPVPGGVGLMTRAMLLVNTVQAACQQS